VIELVLLYDKLTHPEQQTKVLRIFQ